MNTNKTTTTKVFFFIYFGVHYLGKYDIFEQFSIVFHLGLMQMAKERLDASMTTVKYVVVKFYSFPKIQKKYT